MRHQDGTIAVPGGTVWFTRVGGGAGLPLLVVHGGPGLPHDYLRSLERLADEREVIFWDQLGCGNSPCPPDPQLWTLERSVAEMDAVVSGPEYQAAIRIWNETYLCRVRPWPVELHDAFSRAGGEIFATMFGPSDFHITGTIRDWEVLDRLGEITGPTLVLAGRYDECVPEHMQEMQRRIPGSRFHMFQSSSHMPFIEEPGEFDRVMRDFLRQHDSPRC